VQVAPAQIVLLANIHQHEQVVALVAPRANSLPQRVQPHAAIVPLVLTVPSPLQPCVLLAQVADTVTAQVCPTVRFVLRELTPPVVMQVATLVLMVPPLQMKLQVVMSCVLRVLTSLVLVA
jgi:hypothetical protein